MEVTLLKGEFLCCKIWPLRLPVGQADFFFLIFYFFFFYFNLGVLNGPLGLCVLLPAVFHVRMLGVRGQKQVERCPS